MAAITFACGTPHGGAFDSTISLAAEAAKADHEVRVIAASDDAYQRLPRLTSALVRMQRANQRLGGVAWRVHDRLSASTTSEACADLWVERATDVPSAVRRLHGRGAVLVINSVRRLDLNRLLNVSRRSDSHAVWYLREASSLTFAAEHGPAFGTLVANSRPLAEQAGRLAGRACHYVPSVISREGLVEPGRRDVLLAINPIPSHGLDVVLSLARALPDRRFVLQESWPLDASAIADLRRSIADLANVELRLRVARSEVFQDAWALLLPHSGSAIGASRPRVALEAQLLGIPILAHDITGLSAVAASKELLVPEGAPPEAWLGVIDLVDRSYERLSRESRAFADREMPTPGEVWKAFARACGLPLDRINQR